ncbi:enoyl-CoA hydratase [Prauserella marina]|uniref:Enoyl-CoA hydratase/carnithine racemase n=1 Tax=Prauserella marina TaxID=530584 RepID=A0A222VSD9_9PSEU|nr:enoyl-CoA hydratase-related protein [Prauserella marina]ASR36824.1 enoyl-CoA hydratase [Prauserella marina]PWV80263.1 enoyl-CoA hydratase/carnithine racemase [Prauserella marina]SDD50529.1 Enoyl-CoA hydratase/carnithine racemase [Prauserella marina]
MDSAHSTGPTGDYAEITYAVADRIATITLNRPKARNGYTIRMADELAAAFDRADADDDVRVVVLAAEGTDFSVGADLSGGGFDFDAEAGPDPHWQEPAGRCSRRVFLMNKPVIAAIQGASIGGGLTITLPADYRLAASNARFGFVFVRRGIYPEGASAWFLPKLVGLGKAMDWMISGRVFGVDEALAAGLVHSVHEPEELLGAAYELAADLASGTAPVSVAVTRQLLYRMSNLDSPFPVHEVDSRLIASIAKNPDAVEGVLSFLQKRPPRFQLRASTDQPDFLPWKET